MEIVVIQTKNNGSICEVRKAPSSREELWREFNEGDCPNDLNSSYLIEGEKYNFYFQMI